VLQLFQAAVQHGKGGYGLCILPAAQQPSSQDVLQLLEAAVQRGSASSILALCKLPAAKTFSKKAVAGLLQAAAAKLLGGVLGGACAAALHELRGACCCN
jgi:hypothetical protein